MIEHSWAVKTDVAATTNANSYSQPRTDIAIANQHKSINTGQRAAAPTAQMQRERFNSLNRLTFARRKPEEDFDFESLL